MVKQKSEYLTKALVILMIVSLVVGAVLLGACDKNKKNKATLQHTMIGKTFSSESGTNLFDVSFVVTNQTSSELTISPYSYQLEIDSEPNDLRFPCQMWKTGDDQEYNLNPIVIAANQSVTITLQFNILQTEAFYAGREWSEP